MDDVTFKGGGPLDGQTMTRPQAFDGIDPSTLDRALMAGPGGYYEVDLDEGVGWWHDGEVPELQPLVDEALKEIRAALGPARKLIAAKEQEARALAFTLAGRFPELRSGTTVANYASRLTSLGLNGLPLHVQAFLFEAATEATLGREERALLLLSLDPDLRSTAADLGFPIERMESLLRGEG